MPKARTLTEADLYEPIARYLDGLGYTVRGEVMDCDVTATRGDDLVVIEMKRTFCTALLVQATKRQRITDSVYIALPRPKQTPHWRGIRRLLRRLELGLIFVSFGRRRKPRVEVVFHPIPHQRQKRKAAKRAVLTEMEGRSGDFNCGGSTRRKILTAYRENAIEIACYLDAMGPMSPRQLRDLGTGAKTLSILYSNFYGWFERVDRGVYALRARGREEMGEFGKLANQYREDVESKTASA
ncbi:MAG: DUF2161 family putative PD-(D/E)XK-type phosphodiesterase [Armatimonadetes bacterium]|nr:DUF2161 family putative PD-(D/E)XK-type phosphodiesterase [Armatimonadota bacterium]